jgi:class 3 adenylate cyclase
VASRIPGAKFVEFPGEDHLPFVGDQDAILDEIEEFLTGERHAPDSNRVLATVLFVHIVGAPAPSPESAASAGGGMLYRFVAHVRKEVQLFRGRATEVRDTGISATFDGPARAIRCATAILETARRLQIEARAGLHTGEIDIYDDRVEGVAVQVGERVAARAEVGEALVSSTVKDIVAGSGFEFEERGTEHLDTIGEVRRFAVKT